jgi:hypothetical protein
MRGAKFGLSLYHFFHVLRKGGAAFLAASGIAVPRKTLLLLGAIPNFCLLFGYTPSGGCPGEKNTIGEGPAECEAPTEIFPAGHSFSKICSARHAEQCSPASPGTPTCSATTMRQIPIDPDLTGPWSVGSER